MRLFTSTLALGAALIAAAPVAFAQDRSPPGGASIGATTATGSMGTGTTMGRSNAVGASTNGSGSTTGGLPDGSGSVKGTATGGPSGGNPNKN